MRPKKLFSRVALPVDAARPGFEGGYAFRLCRGGIELTGAKLCGSERREWGARGKRPGPWRKNVRATFAQAGDYYECMARLQGILCRQPALTSTPTSRKRGAISRAP